MQRCQITTPIRAGGLEIPDKRRSQILTRTLMLGVNANKSSIRRPLTETCIHVGKPYVGLSTWAYSYPVIKGQCTLHERDLSDIKHYSSKMKFAKDLPLQ